MNQSEAQTITAEIRAIRPDWTEAGIMAQLAKLRSRDTDAVRHACMHAAHNRNDQRTPAILSMDGTHWDGTKYGQRPASSNNGLKQARCEICGRTRQGHDTAESKVAAEQRHDWTTEAPTATRQLPAAALGLKAVA